MQTRKPNRSRKSSKSQAERTSDRTFGITLLSAGAAALGIGAAVGALLFRRREGLAAGHPVPDLAPEAVVPPVTTPPSNQEPEAPAIPPAERAPEHFRPDPTAVPTAEEREALRPATGPAPTLVADRGEITADSQDAA